MQGDSSALVRVVGYDEAASDATYRDAAEVLQSASGGRGRSRKDLFNHLVSRTPSASEQGSEDGSFVVVARDGTSRNRIVGVAVAVKNGTVGWFGHIAVDEAYPVPQEPDPTSPWDLLEAKRIELLERRGVTTIHLFAQERLYAFDQRHGFQPDDLAFNVYRGAPSAALPPLPAGMELSALSGSDLGALLALDEQATGEHRGWLFDPALPNAWGVRDAGGKLLAYSYQFPHGIGPIVVASSDPAVARPLALHLLSKREPGPVIAFAGGPARGWLGNNGFAIEPGVQRWTRVKSGESATPTPQPDWIWNLFSLGIG